MKIAIVGSGMAGLVAARRLAMRGHDVHLLERAPQIGLDGHGVDVGSEEGTLRIADVPSRMFNRHLWPNLCKLYDEIGVKVGSVDASQSFGFVDLGSSSSQPSFREGRERGTRVNCADAALPKETVRSTYARVKNAHRPEPKLTLPWWSGLAGLTKRRVRTGRKIFRDVQRLQTDGTADLKKGIVRRVTLGDYLSGNDYTDEFIHAFLYPTLSSTVCTCSFEALRNYPATIILSALKKLRDGGLMQTVDGSADVVKRLLASTAVAPTALPAAETAPLPQGGRAASNSPLGESRAPARRGGDSPPRPLVPRSRPSQGRVAEKPEKSELKKLHDLQAGGLQAAVATPTQMRLQVRLNCNVVRVEETEHGVGVWTGNPRNNLRENFDHVICATQANHALKIVSGLSASDQKTLGGFQYETVPVVVHSDENLMPPNRRHWSTFNMLSDESSGRSMCTVWLNRFHRRWPEVSSEQTKNVFQTIMPLFTPHDETVIRSVELQRPVVTPDSYQRWEQLHQRHSQNHQRISFVGSYAIEGIPLLESAVVSANRVADAILRREKVSTAE